MATGYSFDGLVRQVNSPVPEPDFYLPLNSDIAIRNGFGDMTYSRASAGDYINKSGLLVKADADQPRFTQDGLLFEKGSTNICIHSSLNAEGWGKHWDRYDLVNNEPDPVGGTDAVRLDYRGDNGETGLTKAWVRSMIGAGDFTVSVWAKASEPLPMYISAYADNKTRNSAPINIGTEWQRVSATFTNTIADTNNSPIWFNVNSNSSFAGKKLWLYFAQCEEGKGYTSPLPTEGTAVTRAEDWNFGFPTMGNVPPHWSTGVTIYADLNIFSDGSDQILIYPGLNIGSWASSYRFLIDNSYSKKIELSIAGFGDYPGWQKLKWICRYDPNTQNMDMWINERHKKLPNIVADPQDLTVANQITYIGCASNGPNITSGYFNSFKIWNHPLTDAQIANLGGQ